MKALTAVMAFAVMAGVTLGLARVPHAIFYEHPHLIYAHWHRRDLDD
jgi:hypothetical protein